MNSKNILRILIIFLIVGFSVYAESSFSQKKFAISLYAAKPNIKSNAIDVRTDETGVLLQSLNAIQSGIPERQSYGLYGLSTIGSSEVIASNFLLSMDYRILNWLSLGGSIEQTNIQLKNLPFIGVNTNVIFLPLFFMISRDFSFIDTQLLIRTNEKWDPINTLNFNIYFYFPEIISLEPFGGLRVGYGTVSGGNIVKVGMDLGFKYPLLNFFSIGFMVYYNDMNINSSQGGTTNIQESGIRVGLGINF